MNFRDAEYDLLHELGDQNIPEPDAKAVYVSTFGDYFRRLKLQWDEPLTYEQFQRLCAILNIMLPDSELGYSGSHRVDGQVLTMRWLAPERFSKDSNVEVEVKLTIPLAGTVVTKAKMTNYEINHALFIDSRRRKLALLTED